MRFTKMQGIGNDYLYVSLFDERVEDPSALAAAMSRPHFGVGADGLVLIGPSEQADFAMRIFNADGSEGEMCGNATRCVAKYVYERGLTRRRELTLETRAGIRRLWLTVSDGRVGHVRVSMGRPDFSAAAVPVLLPQETAVDYALEAAGAPLRATSVSMGNPHTVIFVPALDGIPFETWGAAIERHPLFPRRTNVEFVEMLGREACRVRVWERGVGETLACGTGACAVLSAAAQTGRGERAMEIRLPGGALRVSWEADGEVYQEGPAEFVFDGEWPEKG